MRLLLEWAGTLVLVGVLCASTWMSQSSELRGRDVGARPASRSRPGARRVVASFGALEWMLVAGGVLFLVAMIFRTLDQLL